LRRIPVGHRYCRFDVPRAIPSIPAVNYAGFEVSVDRFDLSPQAEARLMFETPDGRHRLAAFRVRASHADPVEAPEIVRCDCCGSDDPDLFGKKDGLTIVQCRGCGLAFTSPRPDFARIGQRYSQQYFLNEYLSSMHSDHEAHRARWNYYLDQVERFKALNSRLFEVGTGAGYLLKEAVRRGWTVSGIDVNPAAVTYARDTLGLDVTCHNIDSSDFALPEGAFGAILLESTLEHFLSPRRVIAACARALQAGGGLFIWTLAADGDVLMREGMAMTYVGPSEHLSYFSATALCRLCEDNDLRVERVWRDETSDSIAVVASKRIDRSEPAEIDQQA
jgi:SAM-dependent methyltransferase